MQADDAAGYEWKTAELNCSHRYLLPALMAALARPDFASLPRRLFDLGCGNGACADYIASRGWDVSAVDPSVQGISHAKANYPRIRCELGSTTDDLAARFGTFPFVISLEVVEHVYAPRKYASTLYSL